MTVPAERPSSPTLEEVCSLPRPTLEQRLALVRREFLPHVLRSQQLEDGVRWEFPDEPGQVTRLERLIELERACCSGISFALERGEGLWLAIRGIDPNAELFASLERAAAPQPTGLARFAKAGGLGMAISFVVFCVVPIGVAAVAGAAVAAPLAGLESPLSLGLGALVAGVGAWLWLRRRDAGARRC